jgi:hypothetical protein
MGMPLGWFDGERPSIYPVFALGEINGNPDGKE